MIILIPASISGVIYYLGYFFKHLGGTVLPYIGRAYGSILLKIVFFKQVCEWVEGGYKKVQESGDDL